MAEAPNAPTSPRVGRVRMWWEIAIVLALSLGQSAIYSIVSIIASSTAGKALSDQSTALNPSQAPRQWLDFTYQFLDVVFALVPVALAIFLLWTPLVSGFRRIGLDFSRPWRDVGGGFLLLVIIGVPGLGFYALARVIGINLQVDASPLQTYWWTIPILVLSAIRAALQEEVIVIGYLFTRLRQLGWGDWWIILATSLLRGSYHLYQGFGAFVGNAVMGVAFGWCYRRWGRTAPLVVAHSLLDIISFVGYPLAVTWWPGVFA